MKPLLFALLTLALLTTRSAAAALNEQQIVALIAAVRAEISQTYPVAAIADLYLQALSDSGLSERLAGQEDCAVAANLTTLLRAAHQDLHLTVLCWRDLQPFDRQMSPAAALQFEPGIQAVERLSGSRIAYIRSAGPWRNDDESYEMTAHAMALAAHAEAVIIDVRDNPGGHGEIGRFIASYFLPPGRPILFLRGRHRAGEDEFQKQTLPYVPGPRLTDAKLYILVNHRTTSAAEGFAFGLQHMKRATIIGQATAGAGISMVLRALPGGMGLSLPFELNEAPDGSPGWEGRGVIPDIVTAPGGERDAALDLINRAADH